MDLNRRVYRLSPPRDFGAETIAVAFAKTSRSPEPFDVIANELNDDKSREFSENGLWVMALKRRGTCGFASRAGKRFAFGNRNG